MKRRWIIGVPALLTAVALGLSLLAVVRRHRAESLLAEGEKRERAIQATILRFHTRIPASRAERRDSPTDTARPAPAADEKPASRPDLNAIFAAHPELQIAYEKATIGKLHQTYDRFWHRLGLSPVQVEQVIAILMHDDENEMDLAMTARALKLPADDPTLRQFRNNETVATASALQSVLGLEGYRGLQDYNRVLGMQPTTEDVASLTAASGSPMTGAQAEQLTRTLAEASAVYRDGGQPNWLSTDWDQVLANAASFLTPAQLIALQAKAQQAKAAAMVSQFYASHPAH